MGALLICPECAFEWVPGDELESSEDDPVTRDEVGNILADGYNVMIVKDVKVKGSSKILKLGTRVRRIRLVLGPGRHDIEAKIEGFGPLYLRSGTMKIT